MLHLSWARIIQNFENRYDWDNMWGHELFIAPSPSPLPFLQEYRHASRCLKRNSVRIFNLRKIKQIYINEKIH